MKTITFKCTLLSDLVFNLKTATEGNQQTLDYIPGSAVYGLVASKFYTEFIAQNGINIFHSGGVIFGDAHPLQSGQRTYRTPAWWYHKKGSGFNQGIYSPLYKAKDGEPQLKQCRGGYISIIENNKFTEFTPKKRFSIKSAYDSKMRRSEESKMYGYQALVKGTEWGFEMRYNDAFQSEARQIQEFLIGIKPIGKSKSAEYGLVNIEIGNFTTLPESSIKSEKDYCLLYADSRLAFFDSQGQPTFMPTPEQLGVSNGEILWNFSQIRTMQYAPFNGKRKTRDAERFCIEKGSVFYIKKNNGFSLNLQESGDYVGYFKSEGFGRLMVDPAFLNNDEEGTITLKYIETHQKQPELINSEKVTLSGQDSVVFDFLERENQIELQNEIVLKKVNEFVNKNLTKFRGEKFSSQWGTIRSIAAKSKDKQALEASLFYAGDQGNNNKVINAGYLVHGVAADKWKERGRIQVLTQFIKDINDGNVVLAVVNLASQMAKACRKEEQNG
ncbi:MAG: hypothetical protein KGZ81_01245 [Flavobacteriales bacterium]|nr:hypothetical protein [Flavobacteriales bacterium]